MSTEVLAVSVTRLHDRFVKKNGREPSDADVYDMARWAWIRIGDRAMSCRLVFACVHGRVKGVFEVQEWFSCGEARNRPELRPSAPEGSLRYKEIERDVEENRRKAFIGNVADCANHFVGKEAPRLCGPIGYTTVNS